MDKDLNNLVYQVRRDILRMVHQAKSGHPGGSLGCTEFFIVMFNKILNFNLPFSKDGINEDVFLLSNGHISPVYYSILSRIGFFELNEFDPFFNYRATQFMVENGLPAYLEWRDDLSWHPYGRDVSTTSQVMLHATTATLYQIFGMGTSLYDFTILFPVVIGSLTAVVIFAIVRTIGGTTAGLFASLFFAVSPIIIMRGSIGWFKSEPLGLFYGLLAVYLLISGIKSDKGKVSIAKIVGGGILLAFGLASWGGIQFFILPIGLLFLALPFLRKDNKFVIWVSVIFASVFLLITMSFEKTGFAFVSVAI